MIFNSRHDADIFFRDRVESGFDCTMSSRFEDGQIIYDVTCSGFVQPPSPVRRPTVVLPTVPPKQMTLMPYEVTIELPHELRDYQKAAVQEALRNRHIIIELPTGTGKTNTALAIVNEVIKDNPGSTALVIVPYQVLVTQWIEDGFQAAGVEATGVSAMGKKWAQFTVTTYQSAIRDISRVLTYDIIIFDEVHHLFAEGSSSILRALSTLPDFDRKFLIGLTASIRTGEGPEVELQDRFFPVRFSKTLREFQQSDLGVRTLFKAIPVNLSYSDMEKYNNLTATIRSVQNSLGPMPDWAKYTRSPDPVIRKKAFTGLTAFAERKALLVNDPNKLREAIRLIKSIPGQVIVFTDTIDSIERVEEALRMEKIPEGSIYSGVKPAERKRIIEGLRDGTIKVLVGANAITEGLDIPRIDNAVFMNAAYSSQRMMIQRAGRILRPLPGKTATIYILYAPNTIEERNVGSFRELIGE